MPKDQTSRALLRARRAKETLPFAFLVYQDGTIWTARSVLTGHIARGATERAAVAALQQVIDVSIYVAAEQGGLTPSQWMKMQRPDRGEFLVEFCSLVAEGIEQKTETATGQSGCVLQMSILRRAG